MLIFSTERIIILIRKESKCWDFPQAQKLNKNLPFPSDFTFEPKEVKPKNAKFIANYYCV
jgi:hypothetical protein